MVVPFIQRSAFLRALVLATAIFSFLLWLYVVLRIVFNHVSPISPFIGHIPSLPFWIVGAWAFALSFVCTFLYLWIWSRFSRRGAMLGSYEDWQP